ncbi:MAG TPA: Holliday junction resolvase RuvX [Flavobacteriales bacterium]|nr:Holliday junction resolvase RuvX [Flavobacteriales bacterium]
MGRIIALDYGTKRVGIATTDPSQIIATGLDTVHPNALVAYLKTYMLTETVDCIVVGEPKRLNNEPSQAGPGADILAATIRKQFPDVKVDRMDERFTSKMAFSAMIEGGLKKKARADKATIDKVSATIILQSYMEQMNSLNR